MSLSLSMQTMADLDLADRARQGDQQAMIELFQRIHESLFRHAFRMLGHEAAAQDVVQEAFARAIEFMPRTRTQLFFKAWVFRIATNLCLRELTRRDRDTAAEPEVAGSLWAGEGIDPARARQQKELGQLVQEALDRLPPRYKQILLLRELEELSYEELSQALQMSEGSVKITLHRARGRFAAEVLAQQLLRDAPSEELSSCPELSRLLSTAAPHKDVVRHLEHCAGCQQGERRELGQLFALLPPLPLAPLGATPPQLSPTRGRSSSSVQGASSLTGVGQGVATGAGAASATGPFSGLTLVVGLAVTAVLGTAIGAIALAGRSDKHHPTAASARAVSPTRSASNVEPADLTPPGLLSPRPGAGLRRDHEESEPEAANRHPTAEGEKQDARVPHTKAARPMPQTEAHRAIPSPARYKARRRSPPPPEKIEQVVDPEMPPLKEPL